MSHSRFKLILIATLCLAALSARPVAADWLITLEGRMIETWGPWDIDGETLTYADASGEEQTLALDQVDLEASEETTALKAGRTYVPREEASEPVPPAPAKRTVTSDDEPRITLYMTSWCGYCRKARKLLTQLDADFAAKDIEKSRQAILEFNQKSGGRGGVPLIDFDGEIVRGYDEKRIRKLVAELQEE